MYKITLSSLRSALTRKAEDHNFLFAKVYKKIILRQRLTWDEMQFTYRILNYFSLYGDEDVQKMAYSMALNYGLLSKDFYVLSDFASLLRYYPVLMLIKATQHNYITESETIDDMDSLFNKSLAESYKEEYYKSEQQFRLGRSVRNFSNLAVVAPTSYGKSHLMVSKSVEKFNDGLSVCIVVPTKSLINQTVSMVLNIKGNRTDVITHPDMYVEKYKHSRFIAVLTQERLMALLAKHDELIIDYLFIDESHNLFKDDDRFLTLSRAIIIASNRKSSVDIDYYSPFIVDPISSLRLVGDGQNSEEIQSRKITEYMKIPRYFLWDNNSQRLALFDQFTANFYEVTESSTDYYQILFSRGGDKNIIYVNKPSGVEKLADALAARAPEIKYSPESQIIIDDACNILSSYVHPSYNLIKLVKHGIVISHGKIPDTIKEYVEFLYRNIPEIRFIVTTSTLLEGVNIPASKLFLMNYSKGAKCLDIPDFRNLVGRVGRYNIIFDLTNPRMELLTPEIYIIKNDDYMAKKANASKFLSEHAKEGVMVEDSINNPLLASYKGSDKESRIVDEVNILANIDKTRGDMYSQINNSKPLLAQTELGAKCYAYNVKIFDIVKYEQIISKKMEHLLDAQIINNGDKLLNTIISVFLEVTYQTGLRIDKHKYGNWIYLLYTKPSIRDIYIRIIDEKADNESSFSALIARYVSIWRGEIGNPVYVGDIGSCGIDGKTGLWNKYHIFQQQTQNLMPSYAAALAKENLDNVDHYIIPFLEILNDFGVVDESFYKRIKYGTDNDFKIALIRAGIDCSLAKIIHENSNLRALILIDQESPVCTDKTSFLKIMHEESISLMYINLVLELL